MHAVSGNHIITALAPIVATRVSLAAGMTAMRIVNVKVLCTLLLQWYLLPLICVLPFPSPTAGLPSEPSLHHHT